MCISRQRQKPAREGEIRNQTNKYAQGITFHLERPKPVHKTKAEAPAKTLNPRIVNSPAATGRGPDFALADARASAKYGGGEIGVNYAKT